MYCAQLDSPIFVMSTNHMSTLQCFGADSVGVSSEDIQTFSISLASFIVYYIGARYVLKAHHSALRAPVTDSKQLEKMKDSELKARAWLLSLPAAFLLSINGVFQLLSTIEKSGGDWKLATYAIYDDADARSRRAVCFFLPFLMCDLIIGVIDYRSKVDLLSGYVHHAIYITLYACSLFCGNTGMLTLYGIIELPTFFLAAGFVFPPLRHDLLQNVFFFLTRILFFGVIFVGIFLDPVAYAAYYPGGLAVYTLSMLAHLMWFRNNIRRDKKAAAATVVGAPAKAMPGTVVVGSKEGEAVEKPQKGDARATSFLAASPTSKKGR